ncbi:AAA family ATPase [Leeuwenhoekiella sp. A2]|uniref:AAA family ATPase n=1 Tax=Leeuwenhoekiella sp. A2 TaxID=3141460 RepID=UPI003A7FDD36
MNKINPFNPNSPIGPGMFAGRYDELVTTEKLLIQAKANKGHGFLLTGQRGIGKTSLLNLLKYKAEGDIDVNGQNLNFLVVDIDITKDTTQQILIKKIEIALKRKLARTEKTRAIFGEIWNFVGRIEAAGVKVNTNSTSDNELIFEEFCYSLADTLNRVTKTTDKSKFDSSYDGLLIMIDEADNACPELDLGTFIKLLYERLQKEKTQHLMVGIAGLPSTKQVLSNSHPSSLRIFDELVLDRLQESDIKYVINRVLEHSKEINGFETEVSERAEKLLINLSEGFPHFIHQYGYCAFDLSDGKKITEKNVIDGAFGTNGAIEKIGDKYYRDDYYNKIKKDSYRQVLVIMAEKLDSWVSRTYIKNRFKGEKATLNNAIAALRTRGIILDKEGSRGMYRLQDKGFAWWIVMNKKREDRDKREQHKK